MRIPLRWLSEYVPVTLPVDELARRLTMSGTEVEGIERTGSQWDGLVVGKILTLGRHPNADRLQVASVDVGAGTPATIVCGADNIAAGQTVPVVLPGTTLGDMRIERRRVRGIESEGMLCSPKELGLSDDHSGILILEDGPTPGTPLPDILGDTVLDAYITPNRPDCLSLTGIAREVAALSGQSLRIPSATVRESGAAIGESTSVSVEAADLCPRYAARLVRGVRIGPSPDWLRRRIEAAGARSVNNVVDVSNYVMLELGQPLHTFDFQRLHGGRIVVRRARDEEAILTLDGEERRMTSSMLAICDADRPVAIAGIMGGADSEVSDATTDILIESASFAPSSIRRTAQALGLRSEASMRFERGIDPAYAGPALDRAAELIAQVAGGAVAPGVIDRYAGPETPRRLRLTGRDVSDLLGVPYAASTVEATLDSLGYDVVAVGGDAWDVGVPSFRRDVTVIPDLIEDLARIQGYDSIEPTLPATAPPPTRPNHWLSFQGQLRSLFLGAGLTEIVGYPLTTKDSMRRLIASGQEGTGGSSDALLPSLQPCGLARHVPTAITVRNPLSAEWSSLRVTLLDNVLRTLATNAKVVDDGVHLFEMGRVYAPGRDDQNAESRQAPDGATLPLERHAVAIGMVGLANPPGWQEAARPVDFWDLKGVLGGAFARLAIPALSWLPGRHPTLHPGRTAWLRLGEQIIGVAGEVHPDSAEAYGLSGRAYVAEIDLESLAAFAMSPSMEASSRFPAVQQDIALIVPSEAPAERVADLIRDAAGPLLRHIRLFDVYTGDQAGHGRKSLAFALTFQAPDRTLTVEEANRVRERIQAELGTTIGATTRMG